jgi:hypothetical protein
MREQAASCDRMGSPFYRQLLLHIARDVESQGICWKVLETHAADPARMKLPLRFLGAIHRLVLEGSLPQLAPGYPSAGGTADPDAAFTALLEILHTDSPLILSHIPATVQYSEVRRSTALLPGFLEVARQTRLPLRLLELGSGAGLNLRWDHYRYETPHHSWGPADSPLVFHARYAGKPPALDTEATVIDRRGCDLNPIDPTTEGGSLTLRQFLWPDQPDRFERLARAIEVARRVPVTIDRADAVSWLRQQLNQWHPGVATVVFHSIVLLYFSSAALADMQAIVNNSALQATADAPLAWLSMEPAADHDEIHLTLWPGGERKLIATAAFHGGCVSALF